MGSNKDSPRNQLLERPWLTPDEVAELLSISLNTLRQYVSKRKIPFIKVPGSNLTRFKSSDLWLWMEGGLNEVEEDAETEAQEG